VLADLVDSRIRGETHGDVIEWRRCLCRAAPAARCTNGMRLDAADVPVDARPV
jgi:hypothetical protein